MSFQLTRTHTSVVLAATTIAASLVVIPSLAEGTGASQDAFCNSLVGADARISSEYNPLLASYASAVAGKPASATADPAREAQLRNDLANAQAALESAQQGVAQSNPSVGVAPSDNASTSDRGLDWVDWSQVDYDTQAKIIEALIVQKMNAYRANAGLPELVVSDTLTTDSRGWSKHMSDTDDFNHDPVFKYWNGVTLDGGETSYAGENIAYNHLENYGDKWGAYGTTKNPMQAADALFDQWKNSSGHDKNMLAQNNVVGVGVHIARHSEGTRVYGTQKFYAITGGSPTISRFHTTGDTASAYGFDGAAFNADNTNYVSGLAGSGDAQRANSWQNKVGSLPGVALPVDVNQLPAKAGSAAPSTPAPAPVETDTSVDANQAVVDAQASVDAAQSALDSYLDSVANEQSTVSPADIDAQLDELAADIAAQTSVRPEKDGGVTMQGGDDNGRYLTAEQYRNALTACTTSAGGYDPAKPADQTNVPNPSIGQPTQQPSAPAPSTPAENPSVGQPTQQPSAPAPSTPAENPSVGQPTQQPTTPAPSTPAENPSVEPSTPAPGAGTPTATIPAVSSEPSPSQVRTDTLAATGSSAVWVAVGAVAVLVAGIGALVASRRAKN
ncbi:cysteine-rich secretory family protein [Actinomyces sp. ICM58]|uniref:CAP domain-containing protein n=1 Tax=Actinomyces sp. ICM58 TaxID=1105030 RepID=UPI0002771A0E|nr:CAP domain-containing protein [Actinomyces sp. ICM58]EJN52542.1 cysteine-rich secretory family protein [Actinomyces sp. ICM58]